MLMIRLGGNKKGFLSNFLYIFYISFWLYVVKRIMQQLETQHSNAKDLQLLIESEYLQVF